MMTVHRWLMICVVVVCQCMGMEANAQQPENRKSSDSTAHVQFDGPDKDGKGYLQLSVPPECNISIDGSVVGTSPAEGGDVVISNLAIGDKYILSVDKKGWFPFYDRITIPENGVAIKRVSLERKTSQLIVTSVPVDAYVTIEGPVRRKQVKNEASVTFDGIIPGDYKVTVTGNDQRLTKKVHIVEANTVFILANLIKNDISVTDTAKPIQFGDCRTYGKLGRIFKIYFPLSVVLIYEKKHVDQFDMLTKSNIGWRLVDANNLKCDFTLTSEEKRKIMYELFHQYDNGSEFTSDSFDTEPGHLPRTDKTQAQFYRIAVNFHQY